MEIFTTVLILTRIRCKYSKLFGSATAGGGGGDDDDDGIRASYGLLVL